MKKIVLTILLSVITISFTFSQENKKSTLHVSFVPPLSTNGKQAAEYSNDVSFNILAGISRNENILTFGGIANIILNDANGIQFAGIYNYVGNNGNGLLFSGILNTVGNDYNGIQFAGILNQAKTVTGIQFGGIGNVSKDINGIQFGGIGNVAQDVNGLQFGGIFNIARHVKGVQFGTIFNVAESSDYPIGLVNIIKNGEKSVGVSYHETGTVITSFRSGGRVLYGIIGAGYNHKADSKKFALEAGFGAHVDIISKLRLNLELKSLNIISSSDVKTLHTSFGVLPAFRILPQIEIFAGPTINYLTTDNLRNKDMFPSHNIWKKFKEDRLSQLYMGYHAGMHFIF